MNAILLMYCMQSNEMSDMSDIVIAIAAGRNLAIFSFFLLLYGRLQLSER